MTIPSLRSVFIIKEQSAQHWTSNGKRYNVFALYDWLKSVNAEPQEIDIDELAYGFDHTNTDESKDSSEFWERADKAGDDPILVVIDDDDRPWIADGNHRFARAQRDGRDTILGYVANERELPSTAIEPKK